MKLFVPEEAPDFIAEEARRLWTSMVSQSCHPGRVTARGSELSS